MALDEAPSAWRIRRARVSARLGIANDAATRALACFATSVSPSRAAIQIAARSGESLKAISSVPVLHANRASRSRYRASTH